MASYFITAQLFFLLAIFAIVAIALALWITYLVKFILYLLQNNTTLKLNDLKRIFGVYVVSNLMVIGYDMILRYKFATTDKLKNHMFEVCRKFFFNTF